MCLHAFVFKFCYYHHPVVGGDINKQTDNPLQFVFMKKANGVLCYVPSSCVSEESLSSVGMSSLSLKSREGEGTGPPGPLVSLVFSSTNSGTVSSSPSGRKSTKSSAGRSNCRETNRHLQLCFVVSRKCLIVALDSTCSNMCIYVGVGVMLRTAMGVSPGLGMVLFGTTFLCSSSGLPSGLASALLLDKLSLLISFSSLGISSLNLMATTRTLLTSISSIISRHE